MSHQIHSWVCTNTGWGTAPANTEAAKLKYKNIDIGILVTAILALAFVEVLRKFVLSEGSYTSAKMIIWSAFTVISLPYIIYGGSELASRARACVS